MLLYSGICYTELGGLTIMAFRVCMQSLRLVTIELSSKITTTITTVAPILVMVHRIYLFPHTQVKMYSYQSGLRMLNKFRAIFKAVSYYISTGFRLIGPLLKLQPWTKLLRKTSVSADCKQLLATLGTYAPLSAPSFPSMLVYYWSTAANCSS